VLCSRTTVVETISKLYQVLSKPGFEIFFHILHNVHKNIAAEENMHKLISRACCSCKAKPL